MTQVRFMDRMEALVFRQLLTFALAVALATATPSPAHANDLSQAEVLEIAGPMSCEFGTFTDKTDRLISIPIVTLDPDILYEYCFKLPKLPKRQLGIKTSGLVQIQTANLGNTSCGTANLFVVKPKRKSIFGKNDRSPRTYASVDAVQPAAVLTYTPGVWRVLMSFNSGCNKYSISASW